MATIGEFLDESSRLIERGEKVFPNLEKIVQAQVPLYLKQAPYRKNEHYFLEVTVSDPERSFLFYKRVCRVSTVRELKEMLFIRYAVPPSEQVWVFDEKILADTQKLCDVGMDRVALFCPVHVRVFQKFTWPTPKVESKTQGAWTCGRCKMQNWAGGKECANCSRVKEGPASRTKDGRRRLAELSDKPRDFMSQRSPEELKEEGDVHVRDMAPSLVEKIGWACPNCTLINNPTRPGCDICTTPRPANYRPPTQQALDTARQNSISVAAGDAVHRPNKAPKPTWKCEVCENVNPLSAASCRKCTVNRYDSPQPISAPRPPQAAPVQNTAPPPQRYNDAPPASYHNDQYFGDSMTIEQSIMPDPREEARAARLRDLIKESFGWKCGTCTTTNDPVDQRCAECQSKRPFNYKVPTERERQALIDTIPPEMLEPPAPKPPPQQQQQHRTPDVADGGAQGGWACSQCSYVNTPRRPGCEMCGSEPPADYDLSQAPADPEEDARLRKQRENERKFIEIENQRQEEELRKMEDVMNMDKVTPDVQFECPVCVCDQEPADGIRLRNCLHDVCNECLTGTVQNDESGDIRCPVCGAQVDDRDIRNVVSPEVWERRNEMLVKLNEASIPNSFHCLTTDCINFVEIVDDINEFVCDICKKMNCITCKAQHENEKCEEYQERLKLEATNNENARLTLEMFERMIQAGDAMRCPKCQIVLQKKEGCDWLRCTGCRTELCWATKGYRWGPGGKGDISGGCRCRVSGQPCVPECRNCH